MFRRTTRPSPFWPAAALLALLAAPHTLPAQDATATVRMTLSGNFNNGSFYKPQLSPGVDIKKL